MVTAFGSICARNPHVSKISSLSERLIFQFKITRTKQQANWSPCDNNGGTCVEIAGADYCVFAADTRISTGYRSSYSRLLQNYSAADVRALQKVLAARHMIYQHQHNKQMSCPAMAQLLSNTLYFERFFPYYSFSVLGGLDSEGTGCVFTYDAVGSYERMGYSAQGSGATPSHTSWTAN